MTSSFPGLHLSPLSGLALRCFCQVYDRFVARVTELTAKLRQGPVLAGETVDCGAMVMPAQLDIVQVSGGMVDMCASFIAVDDDPE